MIAGVDYSMTSPAICLSPLNDFKFENCTFSFLTTSKKYDTVVDNISGKYFEYENEMKRYDTISSHFLDLLLDYNVRVCYIEEYSMGSKGRVFHIAENTGVFKYRMWNFGVDFVTVAPTTIKKFATGKGNANKEKMQESFIQETGKDLKAMLDMTDKQWNPSSDIIDAYYICKYAVHEQQSENNG